MTQSSGIKKPRSASAAEKPPIQKLCREVLYGIRALENYNTGEHDKLLQFFDEVLEDLDEPSYTGDNQLPLIRELVGSEDEQNEIRTKLVQLSEIAQEIENTPTDQRDEEISEAEVQEAIEDAKEVYSKLDSIQSESTGSIL